MSLLLVKSYTRLSQNLINLHLDHFLTMSLLQALDHLSKSPQESLT